ncbi:hypothetical protein, partial [Streptomyces sp. NPDC048577]|uniref:hypothetical protein n=1 Tax=Streptomyces sp. NPDC048577 TaxID=3157209 RepID=UPI00342D08A1
MPAPESLVDVGVTLPLSSCPDRLPADGRRWCRADRGRGTGVRVTGVEPLPDGRPPIRLEHRDGATRGRA